MQIEAFGILRYLQRVHVDALLGGLNSYCEDSFEVSRSAYRDADGSGVVPPEQAAVLSALLDFLFLTFERAQKELRLKRYPSVCHQ